MLSFDERFDSTLLSINATLVALYFSKLPINDIFYALQIACVNNQKVINPTFDDIKKSSFDFYLKSATKSIEF